MTIMMMMMMMMMMICILGRLIIIIISIFVKRHKVLTSEAVPFNICIRM